MPAVLMRAISTKSPRGARTVGRWMLGGLVLLHGALAVVGVGAAALVGEALREAGPSAQAFTPLLLGRALDSGGVLVAALACVLFLTALAAVVDVTLAAGIALGRDVPGPSRRAGGTASRWSAALKGPSPRSWRSSSPTGTWWSSRRSGSPSAAPPSRPCCCTPYRPGFTARGALWCLWGATVLGVAALALSPYASGAPGPVFPEHDFGVWDVTIPGLVTVPAGFLLGRLGGVTDPRRAGGGAPGPEHRREPETV